MSGSSTHPTENAGLPVQEPPLSPGHAADLKTIQVLTEEATKDFILQDYESAVTKFSDASEIIGQYYGVDSEEYAEALYKYGHALLENSRTQNAVLGHQAIPQTSATDIPIDDLQVNTSRFHFEGDDESDGSKTENGDNVDFQADDANASEILEEQGDDLSLAWEILEYSRDIFSQINTEFAKRSLGEVYIKLGDVSLENEKFDQAAIDYREGVKLKTETLAEGDRQIAEAHWRLSLALELTPDKSNQDEAIIHVQKAIEVLNKRKEILQSRLNDYQETCGKGKKIATADDDTVLIDKEIKDIDEFLVDMESKIADIQAIKLSQEQTTPRPSDIALEEYVKLLSSCESSSGAIDTSSTTPVNDVTSLIKRKTVNIDNMTDSSKNNTTTDTPIQEEKKRRAESKTDIDEYEGENELSPNKKVKQAL